MYEHKKQKNINKNKPEYHFYEPEDKIFIAFSRLIQCLDNSFIVHKQAKEFEPS